MEPQTQAQKAISLLERQGMARLSDFTRVGITAAAVSRLRDRGVLRQLGRGLYQLADSPIETHHQLAEASKLVPSGVICSLSALSFYGLTDILPSRVYMTIGTRDRLPTIKTPTLSFFRLNERRRTSGVVKQLIEGVEVKIYNPAKTIVDMFDLSMKASRRYGSNPIALGKILEAMSASLKQGLATPSELAHYANETGNWRLIEPYLSAMMAHG